MVDSIGIAGKIIDINYFENNSSSNVKNADKSTSIFDKAKTSAKNVTGEDTALEDFIQEKTAALFDKSLCPEKLKEGSKIKDALKGSKVPNMELIGNTIANELSSISKNIIKILDSSMSRLQGCKSEADVDKVIKEIENEVQNEKNKIAMYVKRGQKAVELEKVLNPIFNDPSKEKLAKSIDMNKITEDILSAPDIEEKTVKSDEKDDKNLSQNFEKLLKEDEVSNGIDELIKYLKTGEKDNKKGKLDEYIVFDDNSKDTNQKPGNNIADNALNPFKKFLHKFS